jgi:hypothetical protein
MKKLLLILFAGLLVSAAAFADHPADQWGIGPTGGASISIHDSGLFYSNLGLSLKAPAIPVFWGIYSNLSFWVMGAGVTGDYYIIEKNIVDTEATNESGSYDLKLDWFLGVGGFFDFCMWNGGDYAYFDAGVRVPGGVSWHIIEPIELSVGVAACLGVTNWGEEFRFHFAVPMEVSVRFWL